MTDTEKIALLRSMVGEPNDSGEWSDNVLLAFLKIAGAKIISRAYPYDDSKTDVPSKYEVLQCEIACYLLNKRGAEGQTSHSENGISRGYESADVPESMMSVITPCCGVM